MAKLYAKEKILEFENYYYNYNPDNNFISKVSQIKPLSDKESFNFRLSDLKVNKDNIKDTPLWKELFDATVNSRFIFINNRLFSVKNYYILENPYSKFIIDSCEANILVTIDNGYISSYEPILCIPNNIEPILSIAWLETNSILIQMPCYKLVEDIVDFKELDRLLGQLPHA